MQIRDIYYEPHEVSLNVLLEYMKHPSLLHDLLKRNGANKETKKNKYKKC